MVKYQQNAIETQFDLRAYSNRWRGETTIQCVPSIRTCRCYFHRSIMAPCPVFRCREGRNTRKAFQGRWLRMVETSPSHITMPMAAYVFKVCRTVGHTWFVDEVCLQTKPKLSQLRLKYLSPNQKNIASFVSIFLCKLSHIGKMGTITCGLLLFHQPRPVQVKQLCPVAFWRVPWVTVITPIQKENHPSHQFLFWWNGLPERLLEAIKGQKNNWHHQCIAFFGWWYLCFCGCYSRFSMALFCLWLVLQNNDTTNPNPAVLGSLTMIIYYI